MVVLKSVRPAISCSSFGLNGDQLVPLHKVSFVASLLSVRLSSRNNAKLSLVQATKESSTASTNDSAAVFSGENLHQIATNGKATNIVWHKKFSWYSSSARGASAKGLCHMDYRSQWLRFV
ncbi:hypothetical protein Goshw_001752 [Gossypium schwendimanii]|uniref:Uncharacterized protein n=1 Tax=Gossypium schwendimanii TaxID=34291 RepID=A0A7J9LTA6_GOSSC|nr:hypothetical protein [Gossypium schwendimanii]